MNELKISLIQSPLYWKDIGANLSMFEEKIWQLAEIPNIILLPEMFNSGFVMDDSTLAEPMNSRTFRWMKQMAAQKKVAVAGSYMVKEDGNVYNRFVWMNPDGSYQSYDKRHLFRMAGETNHFSSGMSTTVINLSGWKILPLICYDLRFPVWSRNQFDQNTGYKYDVLLYVANWPKARVLAWDSLLQARAIENASYVAGINRIGTDGAGIEYNGHSAVINPKGEYLTQLDVQETSVTVTLHMDELIRYREKFPTHLDADTFYIKS